MLTAVRPAPVHVVRRRLLEDSREQRMAGPADPVLVRELRRAAAACAAGRRDQLQVLHQPVVELHTELGGRPRRHLEALLRWKHPTRGLLDATDSVAVPERGELITGIGTAVLNHACAVARAWQNPDVDSSVVVNVSAAELGRPGFAHEQLRQLSLLGCDRVQGHLLGSPIDPTVADLPITSDPADIAISESTALTTPASLRSVADPPGKAPVFVEIRS